MFYSRVGLQGLCGKSLLNSLPVNLTTTTMSFSSKRTTESKAWKRNSKVVKAERWRKVGPEIGNVDDSIIARRESEYDKGMIQNTIGKEMNEDNAVSETDPQQNINTEGKAGAISWIEDIISLEALSTLREAFFKSDADGSGQLDVEEFRELLKRELNISSKFDDKIDSLFMKIDALNKGEISWFQFCTFIQLEYSEKSENEQRNKEVECSLPVKLRTSRQSVIEYKTKAGKLLPAPRAQGVICGKEGGLWVVDEGAMLSCYSSATLQMKKKKQIKVLRPAKKGISSNGLGKPPLLNDIALMQNHNKIILATSLREFKIYELTTLNEYCQITYLPSIPIILHASYSNRDQVFICWGDALGEVFVLCIRSVGECLRMLKECPEIHDVPTILFDELLHDHHQIRKLVTFHNYNIHTDIVNQVMYCPDMVSLLSCCGAECTALVRIVISDNEPGCITGKLLSNSKIAESDDNSSPSTFVEKKVSKRSYSGCGLHRGRQPHSGGITDVVNSRAACGLFQINKGVHTFDYSDDLNTIVTGGIDKAVRIWNPYFTSAPNAILKGHIAPLTYVTIDQSSGRIFSVSRDKCVKVWDVGEQSLLFTALSTEHQIYGEVQKIIYQSTTSNLFFTTSNEICALQFDGSHSNSVLHRHQHPLTCCIYNREFNQVLTSCEGSVVQVWDLNSGKRITQLSECHGQHAAISDMAIEKMGRR